LRLRTTRRGGGIGVCGRQRIRDSFEYRWKSQRIMDEHTILDELPVSLRTDVTTYNCRILLQNVPFFQNCEPGLIPTVVRLLAPNIFLSGDVIVRYGEFPSEVYFIQSGEVQIVLFSKVVTYLSQVSVKCAPATSARTHAALSTRGGSVWQFLMNVLCRG